LLEAMAQGCPVVSTACLGTRSILQPGSGARVAPENAAEFARHALALLADPARRAQAGNEARRYALGWASTIMAQRMSELYRQVVASQGVASCATTDDMARKCS
jgi:glycosyltransferase involved in cell wall biosynthesis